MSVSDPLIKELKGYTAKFLESHLIGEAITDANPHLAPFGSCLEKIFYAGIISTPNSFGFIRHNDPWTWIEKCGCTKCEFGYVHAVESVREAKNVTTNLGRLRLCIRHLLAKKSLHIPLECLRCAGGEKYYSKNAILGDEILCEILLSVVYQCGKINFKLDLANSSFLDLSWLLPEVVRVEMVPTHNLGEKAVIVKIKSNSVSSESGKISVGDVLDNMNGICICSATSGRLASLLRCQKGLPINVTVVKAIYTHSGQYYPPMIALFREINLDPDDVRSKSLQSTKDEERDEMSITMKRSSGFKLIYVGNVDVGGHGEVKLIDKAFGMLVSSSPKCSARCKKMRKEIIFEVGELGVKGYDPKTNEVILKNSFMEISACGSVSVMANYFAYIAGEEYCNVAKHFKCFVFMTDDDEAACRILQGIGLGFQRTHYAV